MPYSDEKKTIFLHIPKTAGTFTKRVFSIHHLNDPDPKVRPSPQHLTCTLLRERLGDEKYDGYYKFTFVRNPWARILSSYFWRQTLPKKHETPPFTKFIQLAERTVAKRRFYDQEFGDHFIPQIEYTHDVDDVYKFEELESGIVAVAKRLEVDIGPVPPKQFKPHDHYWKYYDENSRTIIAEIYHEEIERFDYSFGGH